jgi:hypothetical protein
LLPVACLLLVTRLAGVPLLRVALLARRLLPVPLLAVTLLARRLLAVTLLARRLLAVTLLARRLLAVTLLPECLGCPVSVGPVAGRAIRLLAVGLLPLDLLTKILLTVPGRPVALGRLPVGALTVASPSLPLSVLTRPERTLLVTTGLVRVLPVRALPRCPAAGRPLLAG